MQTLSRTRRVGGSLIVSIPKEVVKEESLREGELVELDVKKINMNGFGILKGVGPFKEEDELKGQLE